MSVQSLTKIQPLSESHDVQGFEVDTICLSGGEITTHSWCCVGAILLGGSKNGMCPSVRTSVRTSGGFSGLRDFLSLDFAQNRGIGVFLDARSIPDTHFLRKILKTAQTTIFSKI